MINTMMAHIMMTSSNSMMSQVVLRAMHRRIGICLRRQLMIGAMMSSKRNRSKDMLINSSNSNKWLMSMVNSNNNNSSSSNSMISKDMDSSNSNMRIQMMEEWECKIGKLDGDIYC